MEDTMHLERVRITFGAIAAAMFLAVGPATFANPAPTPPPGGDIPANFKVATAADDYVKRDVMIPMRDGVKLHTVIIVPKGAARAPMILDRTPYNAGKFTSGAD